jgi:CCR4-NOT transcriptional regulation complex NOT5 subunit
MALANLIAVRLRFNSSDQKQFFQARIQFFLIVQNQSVGDFYNYCYDVTWLLHKNSDWRRKVSRAQGGFTDKQIL